MEKFLSPPAILHPVSVFIFVQFNMLRLFMQRAHCPEGAMEF
jgi:hypothetical protein